MKYNWVVQSNLITEHLPWIQAFEKLGSNYQSVELIPFDTGLPPINFTENVLFYGSTTLVHRAAAQKEYQPGVFFSEENFNNEKWLEKYGKDFFNHDGQIVTLKEVPNLELEEFFIRPNLDLKAFSGSVLDKPSLASFLERVSAGGYLFDDNLKVMVAPLKAIQKEWRCFMINGKVVASSQYRLKSMLHKKAGCPEEVKEFAEKVAKVWSPAPAFVMDICLMNDGLKMLELNCFNAAGVYHCDVEAIVKATEDL